MSIVVQFCIDLLTRRQANVTTAADDDEDDDDDAVFLLSTLCQLYLDGADGKCSIQCQLISLYLHHV